MAAVEKFEAFRTFGDSRYRVLIGECQQLALAKATGPVPVPAAQLALANQKKDKEPRSYHVCRKCCTCFLCEGTVYSKSVKSVLHCRLLDLKMRYIIICHSEKKVVIYISSGLRQYLLLENVSCQGGWVVQIRKRMKGKAANTLYCVWQTPQQRLLYTMTLGWVYLVWYSCMYGRCWPYWFSISVYSWGLEFHVQVSWMAYTMQILPAQERCRGGRLF